MIIWNEPAYKAMWHDTSNDLMDHDFHKGQGRYGKARDAARAAGVGRRRMAELATASGELAWAAKHWLSAAACFLLAGDAGPMAACVARARALADAGHVPADQPRTWAALAEREAELHALLAAIPAGGPVPALAADPAPLPQP